MLIWLNAQKENENKNKNKGKTQHTVAKNNFEYVFEYEWMKDE